MPSPFPGMNPYLEQPSLWRGVHTAFLVHLATAITPHLKGRYFAEVEESLYIDPTSDAPRLFAVADTAIADPEEKPRPKKPKGGTATAVARVTAPATVAVPAVTKKKVRRLVIRDTNSQEVITVIELLSPSNKEPGTDRNKYIEKRMEVLTSRTGFIELDLLRGGQRLPMHNLPDCDYYALVSRWWERPDMGLWPVKLRDPLPAIPLPLREGEAEPLIELKPVLDQTYDGAGYEYRIYRTPPTPPLSPADAKWATQFIPALPVVV